MQKQEEKVEEKKDIEIEEQNEKVITEVKEEKHEEPIVGKRRKA